MVDTPEQNPEQGEYRIFQITVKCRSCGIQFPSEEIGDNREEGAKKNAIYGHILSHGQGLDPDQPTCSQGGGTQEADYEIVSINPLPPSP